MTTLNVVATVATFELPAAAPAEYGGSDGAAFGAVLNQVMRMTQQVATTAMATQSAKPAELHKPATGEVESTHHLFKLAPVEETASEDGPSVSEIALPIEALSSYLAAFIALFMQAMAPAEAAEATAEAVEGDDFAVAALGISVTQSTPNDGAEDVNALFAQLGVAAPAEGADDSSLSELFATLIESADDELAMQIADRASEGASLRELVVELAASLAQAQSEGESRIEAQALIDARSQVQTQSGAPPVQSLDQLVETLTQLASTVSQSAGEEVNAQVAAAVAAVTTRRNDDASFERLIDEGAVALGPRVESARPVAQLANFVANLTREISAATRPMVEPAEQDGEQVQPSQLVPQLRETTTRVLVALAESAQGLQAARMRGTAQVTIQLNPESLGKITIEVERTSEGVVAKVVAATPEAQRAIADNAESVQEALAGIGLAVTKLEVSGPATASQQPKGFEQVLAAVTPTTQAPAAEQSAQPTDAIARPAAETRPIVVDETAAVSEQQTQVNAAQAAVGQPQVARADASAPVMEAGAANLVRDIADQAGVLMNQGKSEFQIQLRPETLGRLNIKMTLEGGEVTVQMRAESAQAKSAIESSLGQLKQSFQEQGIRVDRFEVVVAQGQLAQEHGHPRRSRGWVDEVRRRPDGRDEGEFAGALAAASRPVDYLA